jgi:O-antigen ligase
MNFGFYKLFRFRARWIDGLLIALAIPLLLIESRLGGAIVIAFICIGIWGVFGKHHSTRLITWPLFWISIAVGLYALVDYIFHALNNPTCVRGMPYHAEFLLFPFISAGLVLVREPMRWLALGAKIALFGFTIIALKEMSGSVHRFGFGTNPVIAAYFFMLLGCICRFDPRASQPVNLIFFYLSLVPAIATGTRIALIFYAVLLIIDLAILFYRGLHIRLNPIAIGGVTILTLGLVGFTATTIPAVQQRIADTAYELNGHTLNRLPGSIEMRSIIMRSGIDSFLSAPVMGAGKCKAIKTLADSVNKVDSSTTFNFFHNMWIDSLAFYGLVGFCLFLSWCIMMVAAVWRTPVSFHGDQTSPHTFQANLQVICLAFMIFLYGLTGSFASDDRMIAATFLVFAALINEKQRRALWRKIRL